MYPYSHAGFRRVTSPETILPILPILPFLRSKKKSLTLSMREIRLQHECVTWFHNSYCLAPAPKKRPLILAIPNEYGQFHYHPGLYPGAADLLIIAPEIKPLFVELKLKSNRQSKNQIKFQAHAMQAGANYYICRSLDEFKNLIWTTIGYPAS